MAVTYIHRRFLDECRAQGMEIVYHKPSVLGGFSFLRALSRERPDLLVLVNFAPEKHAPLQILDQIRAPRMVWFLDDPHNFINADVRFGTNDFLFSGICPMKHFSERMARYRWIIFLRCRSRSDRSESARNIHRSGEFYWAGRFF
jgi:hypothetical protein